MANTVFGGPGTVVRMNLALLGTTPGNALYTSELAQTGTDNANLAAFANSFTTATVGNLPDAALAGKVLFNLLGHDPSNTSDLQGLVTSLLAANPGNRGVVIYQLAALLSDQEANPVYGAPAIVFNNQTLNGYYYSVLPSSVVAIVPPFGPHPGGWQNFVLTTGMDAPVADAQFGSNNTFVGTEATLNAGDVLTGVGGTDILRFSTSGLKPAIATGFHTSGIPTALVTSDTLGGTYFDTSGMAGVTALVNDNSSTDVTFGNLASIVKLTVNNISGGSTQVVYAADAVKGNADAMAIALSNNKTIPTGAAIGGISANGIEAFNITTSGGASLLSELASSGSLRKLTVSGDQDLTLLKVDFWGAAQTSNVDASALTGKLSLGLGSAGGANLSVVVTGGHGTDSVRFTGTLANYQLNLGAAQATVHNTQASTAADGNVTLRGVERLRFSDQSLALDVAPSQAAGKAIEMVAAVLGVGAISDKAVMGTYLAYFDSGATLLDGARLLLDSGTLASLAGGSGNAALVRLVWANSTGSAPDAATLASQVAALDSHALTQAEWLAYSAGSAPNQLHVQLAGFAQTGLAYL
jgi:hypothetical protein